MIELRYITKHFGSFVALKDLNFTVHPGEFLTILGPSGCGKTTTLRLVAGFENPSEGDILMDGVSILAKHPHQRCVNTVFQNYALFPHMTVWDNVAFGPRMNGIPKHEIQQRVGAVLEMVQMSDYAKRRPRELSGGEQQRVAVARAIVNQPRVLLLDEPLGALDLKLRKQMQLQLKRLQRQLGITFIYVTHDQEEALIMSDRIGVMNGGVLEQVGTPREIYERPRTVFVADFIGETNLLPATVLAACELGVRVQIGVIQLLLPPKVSLSPGEKIHIAIRPEHLALTRNQKSDNAVYLEGDIVDRVYAGAAAKTVVRLDTGDLVCVNSPVGQEHPSDRESRILLRLDSEQAVILKA